MLKLTTISFLLLLSLPSWNCEQPIDCSKVKNGKFFYYAKLDGRKISIERKDSLQIEVDPTKNSILRSKIVWVDKCRFKMYVNAYSESKLEREDSILATKVVTIEILNVTPDFYTCNVNFYTSKKEYNLKDTIYIQK